MKIGRKVKVLVDYSRYEVYERKNKYRKIIISIFYPADSSFTQENQAYYSDLYEPSVESFIKVMNELGVEEDIEKIPINTYNDAPIDNNQDILPVIIYSPGYGVGRDMAMYNIEALVKEGYMVITLGHIFDTLITILPNGEVVYEFEELSKIDEDNFDEMNIEMKKLIDIRKEDIIFLIDHLNRINETDEVFKGRLDLERIGVIGHSVGGGAILEAAIEEKKIKAGIILDGSLQLLSIKERLEKGGFIEKPFLSFRQHNSTYQLMKENSTLSKENAEKISSLIRDGQKQLYEFLNGYKSFIKLKDAKHNTFNDLPVLFKGKSIFHDGMPIERAHKIINLVSIKFFNEFLLNKKREYQDFINYTQIYPELYKINEEGEII